MRDARVWTVLLAVAMGSWVAAISAGADQLIAAVVEKTGDEIGAQIDRLLVRCDGVEFPADRQRAWAVVELFGPLPDERGTDLLASHPDWLALSADGKATLPNTPCYALPAVREARMGQIISLATQGAAGVCLCALPRTDWPQDVSIARSFGFNPPALQAFEARYGRDPAAALEASVDRALFAGLKADMLRELLLEVRAKKPDIKLALACAATDLVPYSATGAALDLPDWIAAGLIDEVMVFSGRPTNLVPLKLHTDRELKTWVWCRGGDAETLAAAAATAARTPGADGVVLDVPGDLAQALAALRTAQERQAARLAEQQELREAVAKGDLVPAAGTELSGPVDQATIHGVAQSFRVDKPTRAQAVGIVATLRGPTASGLAPLVLSIRPDAGDKPGEEVLATATLGPEDFAHEPAYQWAYARLDKPLKLQPGEVYWLYGPDTQAAGGSYVWRTHKGDVYPGGHAWSCRYDYTRFDWTFSILTAKE